jgi:hypothetical protein
LVLLWGHSVLLTEGLEKAGVVTKTKALIGRGDALAAGYGVSALVEALLDDVLVQGNSQGVLEKVGHVVLADEELAGDVIKGKGIFEIALHIREYVLEKRQLIASTFFVVLIIDDPVDGQDQVAKA